MDQRRLRQLFDRGVERRAPRAKIVIELKDDCSEFSQDWRIKEILERYSAFVSVPINLNGKRINTIQALWLRNKNEIKEEEYTEFYKFQAHAYDEPRLRCTSAPMLPSRSTPCSSSQGQHREARMAGWSPRRPLLPQGPDRRQTEGLLPEWLRFLKGVVDSEDCRSTFPARPCRTAR